MKNKEQQVENLENQLEQDPLLKHLVETTNSSKDAVLDNIKKQQLKDTVQQDPLLKHIIQTTDSAVNGTIKAKR